MLPEVAVKVSVALDGGEMTLVTLRDFSDKLDVHATERPAAIVEAKRVNLKDGDKRAVSMQDICDAQPAERGANDGDTKAVCNSVRPQGWRRFKHELGTCGSRAECDCNVPLSLCEASVLDNVRHTLVVNPVGDRAGIHVEKRANTRACATRNVGRDTFDARAEAVEIAVAG